MTTEHIKHIEEQIAHYTLIKKDLKKRLLELSLEQAHKGFSPVRSIEFDDLFQQIDETDAQLQLLTHTLEHAKNTNTHR